MRWLLVLLFLGISFSTPLAQSGQVSAPTPNTAVTVTTQSSVYTGRFLRETDLGGDTYWGLETERGPAMILRSAINKVNVAGAVPVTPQQTETGVQQAALPPFAACRGLELKLQGSNTIGAKLVPELARGFAEVNGFAGELIRPGSTPEEFDAEYSKAESDQHQVYRFQAEGSATAFTGLAAGAADIGMSSRMVKKEELDATRDALGDLQLPGAENVIALDGVVVITNPDNPVSALTLDQISRVFAGEITDWACLGGNPGTIAIYARDAKSGTFDTFKALTLDPEKRKLADSAKRFESSEELSEAVVRDPNGIGFIGFAYVGNAKPLTVGTSCGLKFRPEEFSVKTEEYPLSRRLYLYLPPNSRTAAAQAFVNYALSAPAQEIVAKNKFINLNATAGSAMYTLERNQYNRVRGVTPSASSMRLMDSLSDRIADGLRLSVTFRFKMGSADLDNRALDDLRRLTGYIKQHPGIERRLTLFGFADQKTGSEAVNLELSVRRAKQIAAALEAQGTKIPEQQVQGYGIIAPVACNDSDAAVEKNRRVEVWLRP